MIIKFEGSQCAICKRKKLKIYLCDAVTEPMEFVGHPPKGSEYMSRTCNVPMCEDCRVRITEHTDFCPRHAHEMRFMKGREV